MPLFNSKPKPAPAPQAPVIVTWQCSCGSFNRVPPLGSAREQIAGSTGYTKMESGKMIIMEEKDLIMCHGKETLMLIEY
ncbi:hypothetical protein BOTNAR_0365g00020 [Botryotinia narcissicola]|uniref:Uncharacterized protein n=1 Tax=Botryotinia narcissicola TaxID=278944 RepID=A0A4Z1HQT0_9HELO|nr:hypothetical protein BOTNAR_0365g00020 [Botryotinia narcissicola]